MDATKRQKTRCTARLPPTRRVPEDQNTLSALPRTMPRSIQLSSLDQRRGDQDIQVLLSVLAIVNDLKVELVQLREGVGTLLAASRARERARAQDPAKRCTRCTAWFTSKGEPYPGEVCWRCWLHPPRTRVKDNGRRARHEVTR